MGRIKKAAGPKHEATLSPALSDFVKTATSIPLVNLPAHLSTFPIRWPFPRGDLYHWIPLLDRFDNILDKFNTEYSLLDGPQTRPFRRVLLEKGDGDLENSNSRAGGSGNEEIDTLGYELEGDRELVELILAFSMTLLENCGNRSLYNSSDRLGHLLNSTSLSLLATTLRLAVRLAQRYHASRQRGAVSLQNLSNSLLSSHYNIDLEKVQKLASPFPRPSAAAINGSNAVLAVATTTSPTDSRLRKHPPNNTVSKDSTSKPVHGCDIYTMVRDDKKSSSISAKKSGKSDESIPDNWQEWARVSMSYYQTVPTPPEEKKINTPSSTNIPLGSAPPTPTAARRTSGLSRPSRLSTSDDSSLIASSSATSRNDLSSPGGLKMIEIPVEKITSTALEDILGEFMVELPKHTDYSRYELLNKLRIAFAMSHSLETRRQILAIRILAITNLAYIFPESVFQQRILQQDSDEPRQLQLVYQLTDLIHPPGNREAEIPLRLKTIALGALEALSKHKTRAADIHTALSINVNHGVLLYILRKAAGEMATDDTGGEGPEADEWRDALFSLLEALPASGSRTAESLVGAGLFDVLIEMLTLRTNKAERTHPKVLMFLNTVLYSVREAFQTFANAKGLDMIADLTAWEVESSLAAAKAGNGIPNNFRNQVMDYQIPYFQQQTLRWLFKFVNHMMQHGNANFDRLLRNLIDSPQLLRGLRIVIMNGKMFGSNVWSGAVNILSSFIHNEPTSYAVIAEAGLSKGLLEAITVNDIPDQAPSTQDVLPQSTPSDAANEVFKPTRTESGRTRFERVRRSQLPLAQGVLPATDAIVTIPQAFGAICLNNAGLELFLRSGALDSFFEVFESADHVKSMTSEHDLPRILGNSFDELVRHHPRLKQAVMHAVLLMIARVGALCKAYGEAGAGAKMWTENAEGQLMVSGSCGPSRQSDQSVQSASSTGTVSNVGMSGMRISASGLEEPDNHNDEDEPSVSVYLNVTAKFLAGFFENATLCTGFIQVGGLKHLLEFATLHGLPYDFNTRPASSEISRAIHMLVEQKPHLVLPTLVQRTQEALDKLEPLINHADSISDDTIFFADFTISRDPSGPQTGRGEVTSKPPFDGTEMIKALVNIQNLTNVVHETFSQPIFNPRSNHTVFSQVNLVDLYVPLTKGLGRLHRACVWEEVLLQKSIPDSWKEKTRVRGYGMGSDEADEVFGFITRGGTAQTHEEYAESTTLSGTEVEAQAVSVGARPADSNQFRLPARREETTAPFKNVLALRHLLCQIPTAITQVFQGLGRSLVAKRRPDPYPRQNAYLVADSLAEAAIEQLHYKAPGKSSSREDRYAYWIVALTSIEQMMIESPHTAHSQCLTLVLQAFKKQDGLTAMKDLLGDGFLEEVRSFSRASQKSEFIEGANRVASAYACIKIILSFFAQITTSKYIVESNQTVAIQSSDRDREQPHYFSSAQFLVELRMAVLPSVRAFWDSDFVDSASSPILKSLIDILRTILEGESEHGAFKRSDKLPNRSRAPHKTFAISDEKGNSLKAKGFDSSIVNEALYRCMNSKDLAEEYCRAHQDLPWLSRLPIPAYDQKKEKNPSPRRTPRSEDSEATIPDADRTSQSAFSSSNGRPDEQLPTISNAQIEIAEADENDSRSGSMTPPPPAPGVPPGVADDQGDGMAMSIDNILSITDLLNRNMLPPPASNTVEANDAALELTINADIEKLPKPVTIDDLEDERSAVRKNLIDRALDVLNIHSDVSFELADLITVAAAKAIDAPTMRREIGETLVQSLISFQGDEDFRPAGKKIASYANLLALVLLEKDFYDATIEELKNHFSLLMGFIKIFPEQTAEEPSPWIGQILLIVERILSEDVQPQQIKWTPPENDESKPEDPIAELEEPVIPEDEKIQLFQAILDILPRIGKDESLALSVVRVLVILTRNRHIAAKLGEKRNLQRLFVMVKQLSGTANERLQSSFMLILRHVIEDDETLRQIMRSEIVANFETRVSRPTDTTSFVRHMYHLVLRSPALFVEITNEKLKLVKFDPNQRPQNLKLKSDTKGAIGEAGSGPSVPYTSDARVIDAVAAEEGIEPSTEAREQAAAERAKCADQKAPVVQYPDGIIHYLLCELLSYKDVEDKEPTTAPKDPAKDITVTAMSDVEMTNGETSTPAAVETPIPEPSDSRKHDRSDFKSEQHPIYIYRCFLLQCLTELLSSYNRTKIEFINFSRKADPRAMTPSKPRSGVLNYLLNAVIPVGSLSHDDNNVSALKKSTTSNWAMNVIVSLCLRSSEQGYDKRRGNLDDYESEPELTFVRKFVLEHALKAYKDANMSSEPLEVKYARLLCIADLFNRMISGRINEKGANMPPHPNEINGLTQREIARLMFEKNFISALTSSIADIDLNFPDAKRAVKYILRPLKQLTQTAILLSETSSISTFPGQPDDDEISTATSVSGADDEREETPDLFRNSTLGMFEPNRDEASSSESSDEDEDMYDDEFDEGMEYEDEMEHIEHDIDEVISDDDEEVEGHGPLEGIPGDEPMDVEVVLDGDDDEPSEDDDDQEDSGGTEEDEEVEVVDEINGDNENDSLAIGEEEEWQDEDEEGAGYEGGHAEDPDLSQHMDHEEMRDIVREFENAGNVLQRLDGGDLAMDIENETYMDDVIREEDDEEDEEDEGDDVDMIYEHEYEDDEPGIPEPPWGWAPEDHAVTMPRHDHHPRGYARRSGRNPWTIFPPGGDRAPTYRSHRPSGQPRGNDDGTNPLLQRNGVSVLAGSNSAVGRPAPHDAVASMSEWVHAMDPGSQAGGPFSFVNNIISAIGQRGPGFGTIGGPGGALHFHITGNGSGGPGQLPRELQAVLGLRRPIQESVRISRDPREDVIASTEFLPCSTITRWQEEARLLFGTNSVEKTQRIVNSLLRVLVPPAIEEENTRKAEEAERLEKVEEERKKALEEQKSAQEEAEKAEQDLRARREELARAAANVRAAVQANTNPDDEPCVVPEEAVRSEGAMEGVEVGQPEPVIPPNSESVEEPAAETSEPAARVRITIRGRDVDITNLGIDLEYLEALPEELREEVLVHQVAEQRSNAAVTGEEPSGIDRQFLEALPPEIRDELIQQEAADRRRRERDENRRRSAANGGGAPRAEDIDNASFLATLDPTLRQAILTEQDEDVLGHLPPQIAAEARALGGDRIMHRWNDMPRLNRARGIDRDGRGREPSTRRPQRRQIVQMLDKPGVATLLRLMFVPQQGSAKGTLNDILHNVSQNRQNRAEVVNLILLILQDGSADVNAIERSFAQLSIRAKQSGNHKTPQIVKRSSTGSLITPTNSEITPLMVIQQCLSALVHLTDLNTQIPYFFLTEHETPSGAKGKSARKGKGKEGKASKYALNALLCLLDRKLIMDSSVCMDQLSNLLQIVTHPLNILLKKEKDRGDEENKIEAGPSELAPSAILPATDMSGVPTTAAEDPIRSEDTAMAEVGPVVSENSMEVVVPEATTIEPEPVNGSSTASGAAGVAKESKGVETEDKAKKQRNLTPPVVPEYNLRLVVHILAARECSAKTFRDTLSTINNLSAIPGAKEIFGKELINQAQDLGEAILRDLDDLVPQILSAETGTDVQGMALSKFSPSSSDQAKLLRVLTALDYLFDPKRVEGKSKVAVDAGSKSEITNLPKDNLLTSLYENSTFGPLWSKLSECLSTIRQKDHMLNLATILLPLIEALMVVCKNTTLKDAPTGQYNKDFAITSPVPESHIENLFFRFTEDHRKILNDLVRHNPRLMSGTFSLLVKNPKVLEFDNKRNYFTRRLHSRGTETRVPQPPLQLSVRRNEVFLDSFKSLYFKTGDEMKFGKLSIRFHGEEGVDAGGVTREWFQVLSRQMFNPDYALFVPVAADRTTFHPNKLSHVNDEHHMYFKFIGRIIGKALYEGRALDCHFSRAVYKRILGKPVSIKDMETLDLEYYKSLLWMLENDITDIITETFSVEDEAFGKAQIVDLIEDGRHIAVTEENKQEYVQLVVEYRLTGSVRTQLTEFLKGFHDIVSAELISIFNEQELELLISGLPDIDVDDWKNNTEYHNYSASSAQIQWFWRALRSFDKEERAKLLQFVTGTSKVPLNGFRELEGMNGFSRFNIHRDYGNKDRLPSSHTCFNQLDLPEYESYETLRQQVYTAMTAGSEYFGFA